MKKYLLILFFLFPFVGLDAQPALIKKPVKPKPETSVSVKVAITTKKGVQNTKRRIIEPEMVYVEGSSFYMGSNEHDTKPIHKVYMNSYYIGKYEITQIQWEAVMGTNPSEFKGCSTCPVENVSWNNIQEFIQKLNTQTGINYRLPTEAEWEYAARGGNKSDAYTYSGSNSIESVAWYGDNSGSNTHSVGQKQANELGIYDMSGNVEEWCSDWYSNSYYSNSPVSNPTGANTGSYRVFRGGGWYDNARNCWVATRRSRAPVGRSSAIGFRLALVP